MAHILCQTCRRLYIVSKNKTANWLWPRSAAAAKSLQSCPTLCDHIDSSPSGSTVPGILQARTLEWVPMLDLFQTLGNAEWIKMSKASWSGGDGPRRSKSKQMNRQHCRLMVNAVEKTEAMERIQTLKMWPVLTRVVRELTFTQTPEDLELFYS